MIKRLKSIKINGFRSFTTSNEPISLDAKSVIIYGPNGAGKTNLLSAIEFAVTGHVRDLRQYKESYPDCLTNDEARKAGRVELIFENRNGDEVSVSREVGVSKRIDEIMAQKYFAERCYLSQARMGRLLEIYQNLDEEQNEQPLIRFAREILGTDILDKLIIGSAVISDRRKVSQFERIETRLKKLENQKKESERKTYSLQEDLISLNKDIYEQWRKLDSSVDPGDIDNEIEKIKAFLESDIIGPLDKIRKQKGELDQIRGYTKTLNLEELSRRQEELYETLKTLQSTMQQIGLDSKPSLAKVEEFIVKFDQAHPISKDEQFFLRIQKLNELFRSVSLKIDAEIESSDQIAIELAELESKLKTIKLNEVELSKSLELIKTPQKEILTLLKDLSVYVVSNKCPVCDRDYSELNKGDLITYINTKISKMTLSTREYDDIKQQIRIKQSEHKQLNQNIDAIKKIMAQNEKRSVILSFYKTYKAEIKELLERLVDSSIQWQRYNDEMQQTSVALQEVKTNIMQFADATERARLLYKEYFIEDGMMPEDLVQLITDLGTVFDNKIERLTEKHKIKLELERLIPKKESLSNDLTKLKSTTRDIVLDRNLWKKKNDQIMSLIQNLRQLRKAATDTKAQIIEQFMKGELHRLWLQLFNRLSKNEKFMPQISLPSSSRGRIKTRINAISHTKKEFEIGAVHSTGNLNTAALTLFLAFHLVDEAKHKVLILDDPIQSMDDIHTIELANLLRIIATDADRQIIIAVHEKALYDYLTLELGPKKEIDSLLGIRLNRNPTTKAIEVNPDLFPWKADQLVLS